MAWFHFPTFILDELERLQREIDRAFGAWPLTIREAAGIPLFPAINVGRTKENVVIYVFIPGVDPNKLKLTLEQGVLTIAGERGTWEKQENETVHARERFAGAFKRTLSLPDDLDPDRVEARYRDGILTIVIGRKAHMLPRRITVQ
ncbi:MAG: Hsp20/alpha crystallin family protein [Hydrogenophilus sp.]|nr:Hsp20/alpha crystallin family protein [Hydrogenophilus sp.]